MAFLELHILQNVAPANLNRDDTGNPKDAMFGGVRRARISSQALKRAMRLALRDALPPGELSTRTKRVSELVADRLAEHPRTESLVAASRLFEAAGIVVGDTKKGDAETKYLILLGDDEADALAALAREHWDALTAAKPDLGAMRGPARAALRSSAVDLALFGRMVADLPEVGVDGACSVAHAISTHRLAAEFDYFTALDELARAEETGAAMIESTGFNSATFYRYLAIDLGELEQRVGAERLKTALPAIIRAAVLALPTGKQHAFAAHNPPSFVLAVVRDGAPVSLANAFVAPVRQTEQRDLVRASVDALVAYRDSVAAMYGDADVRTTAAVALGEIELGSLEANRVPTLDALVASVAAAA
jgi:CRISPR system Cascade subunit CasC